MKRNPRKLLTIDQWHTFGKDRKKKQTKKCWPKTCWPIRCEWEKRHERLEIWDPNGFCSQLTAVVIVIVIMTSRFRFHWFPPFNLSLRDCTKSGLTLVSCTSWGDFQFTGLIIYFLIFSFFLFLTFFFVVTSSTCLQLLIEVCFVLIMTFILYSLFCHNKKIIVLT